MENLTQIISPVLGTWLGTSTKVKASKLVLKFNSDTKFQIYGCLFVDVAKSIMIKEREFFMKEVFAEINGEGRYILEENGAIIISGRFAVQQNTFCRDFDSGNLKYTDKDYSRPIETSGKFDKNLRKLLLKDDGEMFGLCEFEKMERM